MMTASRMSGKPQVNSTTALMKESTQPRRNPAMAPAVVPMTIEMAVTPKPTMSEMRMPITSRE